MSVGPPGSATSPVIIIGGGPVGMVLALNLDALGMRCLLVNTEPGTRWQPKGNTHNSRSMEHYRRLGIAAKMRQFGLPADMPTDVRYLTRLNGWELARIAMPSEAEKMRQARSGAMTDQVPEPIFRANQMYVERCLFDHVKTRERIDVRFGWRCTDLRQDTEGVTVEIEEVESGRRQSHRGAYLAGCDGGQSFVRRKLGIRYGGGPALQQEFFGGPHIATYLRAPALYRRILRERCWQYWAVNPEMRGALVTLDGQGEFLFLGRQRAATEPLDPMAIARLFRAMVGEDIEAEFISHNPWTAGLALVADRFAEGRIFLAGDAVHLFTPTGGFGMNTGIDDAANLAWKLAAVITGWGGSELLASYEAERRPVALRNTAAARDLARSVGDVPVEDAIDEDSAAGVAARRKAGEFLSHFGEEFASLGVQLGARYDASPIIAGDGSAPPPDDPAIYVPSAVPGGRAPHLWLGENRSLFDVLGPCFTLLRLGGGNAETQGLEVAAAARGVPLRILDIDADDARDLYGRDLALIRPDQHVAWSGNRLPEDCHALMDQVTGSGIAERRHDMARE